MIDCVYCLDRAGGCSECRKPSHAEPEQESDALRSDLTALQAKVSRTEKFLASLPNLEAELVEVRGRLGAIKAAWHRYQLNDIQQDEFEGVIAERVEQWEPKPAPSGEQAAAPSQLTRRNTRCGLDKRCSHCGVPAGQDCDDVSPAHGRHYQCGPGCQSWENEHPEAAAPEQPLQPGDVVNFKPGTPQYGHQARILRVTHDGRRVELAIVGHEPKPGEAYPSHAIDDVFRVAAATPPVGGATDVERALGLLRKAREEADDEPSDWIALRLLDDAVMAALRELDPSGPDHQVLLAPRGRA